MTRDISDKPLAHLFIHIGKMVRERVSSNLRQSGVHFGQARILEALLRYDKLSQGEIGNGLHIRPATVTNQVKRMEAAGWIDRRHNPKDDRFMNVTLTPKGREAANVMVSAMKQIEDEIRSILTKKETDMLRKRLEKVRNKLGDIDHII